MIEKKIILITGGTGYIGSHAIVAFEEAGYKTVILDNLANSSRDTLVGIEKILGYCPDFYECDIRDRDGLEKIFEKYEFDGVIHFAGLKAVGESCRDIAAYHENNVSGSITLFGVMKQFGVSKIVFSSSATVYHSDNTPPFTEDMPTGSTNPYGTTKLVIERLLEDYTSHAQWSVVSLRYFNPIGAHPSGCIGEIPTGIPNNLLPYILDVALGKREKVSIFGGDYDTSDGTGIRDYVDINDLIDAHILTYRNISYGFEIYNIGTGKGVSVLEMLTCVERVTGKKIPYLIAGRRAGDLAVAFADTSKMKHKYAWKPIRRLEESIGSAWHFSDKQSKVDSKQVFHRITPEK